MSQDPKSDESITSVDPAIRALLEARATGKTPGGEAPLPPDMLRRRDEWKEYAGQPVADQKPDGHTGPNNPDHPLVNHKPGGRGRR